MNKKTEVRSNGLGVLGSVQITLIILKLFDLISWNWWIVFIPIYIATGIIIIITIIVAVIAAIALNNK